MAVLVCGGAGYIGSHAVHQLIAKGEEVSYPSFNEALSALHKMATPRWRRPNEAGNWGIVSGRDWKRIERRQLMSM